MAPRKKRSEAGENEVRLAAQYLITKYREGAELEAAIEADKYIAQGDPERERVWMRVLKAIREMQTPVGTIH